MAQWRFRLGDHATFAAKPQRPTRNLNECRSSEPTIRTQNSTTSFSSAQSVSLGERDFTVVDVAATVFAEVGASLLVVANGLRLLRSETSRAEWACSPVPSQLRLDLDP